MKARKPKVVKENSERWLLTYSDLITLLMIFFILLYAMSSTDARKFENLTGALRQAFNNGQFQMVVIGGSPGKPHAMSGTIPSEKTLLKQIQHEMVRLSKQMGMSPNVIHVGTSREGIVVTLSGNLLFYPGGTELKPNSQIVLARISGLIAHLPNNVRIEGNTDNQVSPDAVYQSNWALSSLRAVSIVEYMSTQGGVAPQRLSAVGEGQYHPVATNTTAAGRARNRHADIVILYPHS